MGSDAAQARELFVLNSTSTFQVFLVNLDLIHRQIKVSVLEGRSEATVPKILSFTE